MSRPMQFAAMTRFFRYFLVGGTAAAINLVIFATLVRLAGMPIYVAATISFLMATMANYLLSVRYAFVSGTRFSRSREIIIVYLVSAVGLAFNQGLLYLFVDWAHVDAILAQALALAGVFVWNYGARRLFVFRQPESVQP